MPHSPNIHSIPKSNAIPSQNQQHKTKRKQTQHRQNKLPLSNTPRPDWHTDTQLNRPTSETSVISDVRKTLAPPILLILSPGTTCLCLSIRGACVDRSILVLPVPFELTSFDLGSVWGLLIWTLTLMVIQRLYRVTWGVCEVYFLISLTSCLVSSFLSFLIHSHLFTRKHSKYLKSSYYRLAQV